MNGFVVILSHGMDDFPLGLYRTMGDAKAAAMVASWDAPERHPFGRDASTPNCIGIMTFAGGMPVDYEVVRTFEEEPADANT